MNNYQEKIDKLTKDLSDLTSEVYNNNFSAFQEFNKKSSFTGGLKVTHYDTLPTKCEVGEVAETGGVLKICSALNTWVSVGSQA